MKYLILPTIIFLLGCENTSKIESGDLILKVNFCKYKNEQGLRLKKAILFKDGIEFKKIQFNGEKEIKVSKIPYGNYKLRYKSMYKKYEYINFKISNNKQKLISICIDKIEYSKNTNVLFLDEMKIDETLIFSVESEGCFHGSKKEIKVKRTKNGFTAIFNNSSIELSNTQFKLFKEFEIELRSNHSAGCSTNDNYSIYNESSHEIYVVNDESCQWKGFDNLIKLLDLKE